MSHRVASITIDFKRVSKCRGSYTRHETRHGMAKFHSESGARRRATLEALERTLEAAGVKFIGTADMQIKGVPDTALIGVAVRMKTSR
jgi:hypothetical protein